MEEDIKAYILKHFHYHPDGTITRDDRANSNGSFDKYGYLIFKVKGHQFKAHRIAWLLNYGDFPKAELDHINRIRDDNRIENLRESNRVQQTHNTAGKINRDTGVVGVYLDKSTKGLKAKYSFHVMGKIYRFRNLSDAVEQRKRLREKLEETYKNG